MTLRGQSFMMSATLKGGGVNQILTFTDGGGRGGPPKSDTTLLDYTDLLSLLLLRNKLSWVRIDGWVAGFIENMANSVCSAKLRLELD